jgi:alpha-galactosidase
MSGKLGMDLQPKDMSAEEKVLSKNAIQEYGKIKHIIQDGDLYRLLSPYENNRVALMYILPDQKEAVVFSYLMKKEIYGNNQALIMHGLDPKRNYLIKEVNKFGKDHSSIQHLQGKSFTGEFLMTYGIRFTMYNEYDSVVLKVVAE